jgi:hypothetical protein
VEIAGADIGVIGRKHQVRRVLARVYRQNPAKSAAYCSLSTNRLWMARHRSPGPPDAYPA